MILMELMDEDLHHLIEDRCRSTREGLPFRQVEAIDIISQIAAGMAYLHDKGIVHGDLKASNVLVNHRGGHIDAKITDFGVSQKIQRDIRGDASSSHANSTLSMYSVNSLSKVVGTTGWMAQKYLICK